MGILLTMHLAAWLSALLALHCQLTEAKFYSSSASSSSASTWSSSSSLEVKSLKSKKHHHRRRSDNRSLVEKIVGYPREREYGRDGQVKPRPDLPSDASENEDFCSIM